MEKQSKGAQKRVNKSREHVYKLSWHQGKIQDRAWQILLMKSKTPNLGMNIENARRQIGGQDSFPDP